MTGSRQVWLVARREMLERGRSRGFLVGTAVMLIVALGAAILPTLLDNGPGVREVGLTGATPAALSGAIAAQSDSLGNEVRMHEYADTAAGEAAVRDEDVDVLVVDGTRLEWRDEIDEQLQAVVTAAIQLVAVQERAYAAGIDPEQLLQLVAPVPVDSVEIGLVAGRSSDDEAAAIVITGLLLMALFIYGSMVLSGVVQEKSSRVVEVLLARMPARNLLIGKVAGIGLLGFAQFTLIATATLVASQVAGTMDTLAISTIVLSWAVAWFVLGYALYATAYGVVGSLASRSEDADSVSAPVGSLLVVAYWASFVAVSEDPEGPWSQLLGLFPATAPFAMPGRIALGAASQWEPLLAVALALATLAGLVVIGGRVYTNAILHSGPRLGLREAWRSGQDARPQRRP